MAVMTVQPPLPLVPEDARPVGAAAAIVEDEDGGRVFVHGNLAYAWDAGDTAGRRLAAVSLVRIKAATQLEVAEAFVWCGLGECRVGRRESAAPVGVWLPRGAGRVSCRCLGRSARKPGLLIVLR